MDINKIVKLKTTKVIGSMGSGSTCILIEEDKENQDNYIVLNSGKKLSIPKVNTEVYDTLFSIGKLYCVYELPDKRLKPHKLYNYFRHYKSDNNYYYYIIGEDLELTGWNASMFLTEDEYHEKLNKGTLDDYIEDVRYDLDKRWGETRYNKTDVLIETFKEIINEKEYISRKHLEVENVNKSSKIILKLPKNKELVIRKKVLKEERQDNVAEKIRKIKHLEVLMTLPYETLGKFYMINSYLLMLEYMSISDNLLLLIQESLSLTEIFQHYTLNEETINNIDKLLNSIIEYIKDLKENKDLENQYIETNITKQLINILENNTELFNSIKENNKDLISFIIKES